MSRNTINNYQDSQALSGPDSGILIETDKTSHLGGNEKRTALGQEDGPSLVTCVVTDGVEAIG
jgi:hypothetical protein